MQSLLGLLGILGEHIVVVAICVAVLLVLAAAFFGLRRVRVFRRLRPRPKISVAPKATEEDARALLREWASDKALSSSRAIATPKPGKEVSAESGEIDQLLKLADLLEKKLLTREEFEEQKKLLLGHDSARAAQSSTTSPSPEADADTPGDEP